MKKTKKALASLAIAGMVLSMAPISVFGAETSNRISDLDRVGTAIAIAANGWTASDSVIVVSADDENIVDALAAAPLAGQLNAPILITYKGALDPKVQQKIVDLKAKNVYAIGALSADVVNSLKAISGVTVEQLQGADRTETAAKVTAKLSKVNGTFVVAYDGKADALSAASFAAANSYSIVIANPDGTIPANETVVAPTYTVGGQVTVAGATALKGADRYATNDAVLNGLTYSYDKVYVANGESLVDALAGAPLAAKTKSPIVLADAAKAATGANDNLTSSSKVIALGGAGAVSDAVLGKVAYVAPATLAVESVSAINAIELQVKFNKPVKKDVAETLANYKINNVALNAGAYVENAPEIELQDDEQTLLITLDTATKLTSDSTYFVEVQNIVDQELTAWDEDYAGTVKFVDETAPTYGAVTYPNNNTAQITFSEPMSAIAASAVKVYDKDGKDVTSTTAGSELGLQGSFAAGDENLKIDLYGADEDATYTVKVFGATDLSSNFAGTLSFNVVKTKADTTKPTVVSVVATALDKFKVTFSEQVIVDPVTAANGYGDFAVDLTTGKLLVADAGIDAVTLDDSKKVLTVDLTAAVAAGLHTVKIDSFFDASRNQQTTEFSKVVDFQADTTAPKLVSTEVRSLAGVDNLLVKLDDSDIALGSDTTDVLSGTYVKDSVEYSFTAFGTPVLYDPDGDAKTDTIAIPLTGQENGVYSVKLNAAAVADKASTPNQSAQISINFNYNATTNSNKPVVVDDDSVSTNGIDAGSNFIAQAVSTPNAITLKFSKDVTVASALNANNYLIDGVNAFETAVFVGDKQTVRLTLKQGAVPVTAVRSFTIKNVADTVGNVMNTKTFNQTFTENVKPTYTASLVAANVIKLDLSEAVTANAIGSAITKGDFNVYKAGTKLAAADVTGVYSDEAGITALVATDAVDAIYIKLAASITDLSVTLEVEPSSSSIVVDANATGTIGADGIVGNKLTTGKVTVTK